ncbi:MAG: DotI/IcmL family type IV secretion protein [Inquilinus sp.]|uniref:DotI/IcmL family type IV secretion protein n=1 Tax=Inquilinus sp. TaxID=1932117 RepID=UPI003F2A01F2
MTFGAVVSENAALGQKHRRLSLLSLLLAVGLLISLGISGTLAYALLWKYPLEKFLWTSDARAVCEAIPLTEPNISTAKLKNFVAETAILLNSYDYRNWRRSIDAVLTSNFTPDGSDAYRAEWSKLGLQPLVERRYYVVSALVTSPPILKEYGTAAGRYYWTLEVPIQIFYQNAIDIRPENRVLVVTVVRVDPTPANPNGIAIDKLVSTQRVGTPQ